ncbi:allatostatins-like [Amphibalanus amphitrite]|uniref:allatostatins-like n=1 Tax=Amphibalanus amphitrite TaxID=1232801 RepID=UPI001C9020A7|nr:allatostatins-like [Amphibalanus amphitrite]
MLLLAFCRPALPLLVLLLVSHCVAIRQPEVRGTDPGTPAAEAAITPRLVSTDADTQSGGAESPSDIPQLAAPQSGESVVRRKREGSDLNAPTRKRSHCSQDLGERPQRYSFGIGKRTPYAFGLGRRGPYSFGLGKRAPYSFGLGKRTPYSFGLGKRRPYSFGLGKRRPYGFGLGKRSWGSWFDGPTTRDLLKRPSYSFGLGKRGAPLSHLWETESLPDGGPLPAPAVEGAAEPMTALTGAGGCRELQKLGRGRGRAELTGPLPGAEQRPGERVPVI